MNTTLSVEQTINQVIQVEMFELVHYKGAPYIKFLMLSSAIEFLGACKDQFKFDEDKHSQDRFNNALNDLFPKKYHKYAKKDSKINLFRELRCGMIHKLSPLTSKIKLTERRHLKGAKDLNMTEDGEGNLIIVLEDLYEDIYQGCEKLKKLFKEGKLPNNKMTQSYIKVFNKSSGHTETNLQQF